MNLIMPVRIKYQSNLKNKNKNCLKRNKLFEFEKKLQVE
jgi:hypothetical protein